MTNSDTESEIIHKLIAWAEKRPDVRAAILNSSRTVPNAPVDPFSDYDIIYVVEDVHPYFDDRAALAEFGPVLTLFHDPIHVDDGFENFGNITQYESGLKIDFSFQPVAWLKWVVSLPELPEDLQLGYTVLLDKDGLAAGLKPPTHLAYIPKPPTERQYQDLVEEFLAETAYVAKNLWRGDLIPMKYNLDYVMKFHCLRTMIDWRWEIDCGWSQKTGAYGKGLKKRAQPEVWQALEQTYVGAGWAENWKALFCTIALFRQVAVEVGAGLGYAYPESMHGRVVAYLERVQALGPGPGQRK